MLTKDSNWPDVNLLPNYLEFENQEAVALKSLIPGASDDAIDLIDSMLQLNPANRLRIEDALKHPFFKRSGGTKAYVKTLADLDVIAKIEKEKNK